MIHSMPSLCSQLPCKRSQGHMSAAACSYFSPQHWYLSYPIFFLFFYFLALVSVASHGHQNVPGYTDAAHMQYSKEDSAGLLPLKELKSASVFLGGESIAIILTVAWLCYGQWQPSMLCGCCHDWYIWPQSKLSIRFPSRDFTLLTIS